MIELEPYGRSARECLASHIRRLKADDALAPVTVIVPTNYAGISVRRALAAESPMINVSFVVGSRLAELLGAPALNAAGLKPLTPWIRQQAVRAALAERPGVFAEVAAHPSTVQELGRTFLELREASDAARRAVATTSRRASDVVALFDRFRELTKGYFDEADLMETAAKHFAGDSQAAHETGAIILYLPRKLSLHLRQFLEAAAAQDRLVAIFGLTGDATVDELTRTAAQSLAGGETVNERDVVQPAATRIVSATEPEEEVREAIRQAMALTAEGTPLHRIAFLYGSRETYAALLDDALTSAGLPHNGPPVRTLAQTIAGRTLLGLPRIAASSGAGDAGYAREVVLDWLTGAPIWHAGREAPSHRWDEISREAGIVKGPEQWAHRLEMYAAEQELKAAEREADGGEHYRRLAGWARDLNEFMAELRRQLGTDEVLTAGAHAARALTWLDTFLPERALIEEAQLDARERVKRQLEEIAGLERELSSQLNVSMNRAEFAQALEEALRVPAGRTGALGDGIFIGPASLAGEMDFDAVFVLGMVEGAFPPASRDDPLLTSEERARAGGELPPGGEAPTERRRAYLAALSSGKTRVLMHPRGDLRSQRPTQPSRWLLEAATALAGQPVYASELEHLLSQPPEWFRVVHSFESALTKEGARGSIQEWDLASLLRFHRRMDRHFLMRPGTGLNPLARGVAARNSRARRGDGLLDGWIGKVSALTAPVPGANIPISPTALETFARCPFRYFLGSVLRVGEIDKPEEVVTIEPATIGLIVHEILQGFFEATAKRPDGFADWSEEERSELKRLTLAAFEKYENRGITGKRLTWRAEQARIERDLQLLLEHELRERRQNRFQFRQAEAAFGVRATAARPNVLPPARFTLADGNEVTFRGVVDRIDVGPNGELAVIDYKTGSTRSFEDLKKEDPMAGGKFLQLPVYALAFRGESPAPVSARYWFISEQAGFDQREMKLDDDAYRAFGGIVNTLVSTMRDGYFPAVPGAEDWRGYATYENCKYCPYDSLCPSSQRTEAWEAAKRDPGLAAFAGLARGEVPGTDTGDD